MSEKTDDAPAVLVRRILAGDKQAESELVLRYSRSLMTMLEFRTGDIQRAEDVHQEAFFIVLQRLRTTGIDNPGKIAGFLHRTAINVLIGQYRKETRRKTDADTDFVQRQSDDRFDQLQQLIREESDDAIRASVQEINNARDRELIYRFYILQEDKPTVCKVLALTSEHFDRVVSRARKRFRQLVERKRLSVVPIEENV